MFTGLIKDIGKIVRVNSNSEGREFVIETLGLIDQIKVDDSVATNGVCLTATKIQAKQFSAQAVHITLEKTNIGTLSAGALVNLELALRPSDRLGGHMVQGHVGATGKITSIRSRGKSYEIEISPPKSTFKYIISEGSVALDGISLTVAKLTDKAFTVSIIPHTFENTTLYAKKVGDLINIEVDMMAKYLENFLRFEKNEESLLKLLGKK